MEICEHQVHIVICYLMPPLRECWYIEPISKHCVLDLWEVPKVQKIACPPHSVR